MTETETETLTEVFNGTKYRLGGHGPRDFRVLAEALAAASESEESDMYGKGKVIEEFQDKLARYLGKESAVFFPSGTMAQQIALRIWSDEKGLKKVAYHPLCHLEIHEENGLKELHRIVPVLLATKERTIGLADVVGMKRRSFGGESSRAGMFGGKASTMKIEVSPMSFFIVMGSLLAPLLMAYSSRRWEKSAFAFDLGYAAALLVFGNIAALTVASIIRRHAVFLTSVHAVFLDPFFLLSGAYLGVYVVYRALLRVLPGSDDRRVRIS